MNNDRLQALQQLYSSPCDFSIARLAQFYSEDACFVDPVHEAKGLPAMQHYFEHAYGGLNHCQFHFAEHAQSGNVLFIRWEMEFSHPSLRGGAVITVPGCSYLQLHEGLISYHRDYYDMGRLLYEQVPILGQLTRWLKQRLAP